jgi:putative membrane protein
MMWWNGEWNAWAWLVMSTGMIVFWGLVLWAVLSVIRGSSTPSGRREVSDPEQILEQRFARGEIDADEYEHRREVLRRGR